MALAGLELLLWYVEARDAGGEEDLAAAEPQRCGSAVAVRLQVSGEDGRPQPRSYLLTCAHVVRCADGRPYAEILCFPPHKGYVRGGNGRRLGEVVHLEARLARISPLSPPFAAGQGDAAGLERQDWVLLELGGVDFLAGSAAIWNAAPPPVGTRVQVGGYPGGSGSRAADGEAWKDGHAVIATIFEELKVRRCPRAGMIGYSCDDIRPGVSGGGVFDRQGRLLGIHRQLADAQGQRRAISAATILDWLATRHGALPLSAPENTQPRPSRRWQSGLLASLLAMVLLLVWRLAIDGKATDGAAAENAIVDFGLNAAKPGEPLDLPLQLRWGQLGEQPMGAPAAGLQLSLRSSSGEPSPAPLLTLDTDGQVLLPLRQPMPGDYSSWQLSAHDPAAAAPLGLDIAPAEIRTAALAARGRQAGPALHLAYGRDVALASELLVPLRTVLPQLMFARASEDGLLQSLTIEADLRGLAAAEREPALAAVRTALQRQAWPQVIEGQASDISPAVSQRMRGSVLRLRGPQGEGTGAVIAPGWLILPSSLLDAATSGCPPANPALLQAEFADGLRALQLRCVDTDLRLALASFDGESPPALALAAASDDLDARPVLLLTYATAPIVLRGHVREFVTVAGWPQPLLIHDAAMPDLDAGAALFDLQTGLLLGLQQGTRWAGLQVHGAAVPAWQLATSPLAALLPGLPTQKLPSPSPDAGTDPLRLASDTPQIIAYDPGFLGAPLPLPLPGAQHRANTLGPVLDYVHFSLRLDTSRRTPALVAANLDRDLWLSPVRSNRHWSDDPRAGALSQAPAAQFGASGLRLRPLLLPEIAAWGALYSVADLAATAAHYRSNATLQFDDFHNAAWLPLLQRLRTELQPQSRRLSLLAGPVLDAGDLFHGSLQMPQQFWLLAAYDNAADPARPHLQAFVLRQYHADTGSFRRPVAEDQQARAVDPAELARLTGLRFYLPGR